jgi:hypothetical protein
MQPDQSSGDRNQFIERFKEKWLAFANEIVLAVAEEEMRIHREELTRRIDACDSSSPTLEHPNV